MKKLTKISLFILGGLLFSGIVYGTTQTFENPIPNNNIASSTDYLADTKWTGVDTDLVAATGRASLELGTMALEANTGSTTITTLGTIITGIWSGTSILDAKIASSTDYLADTKWDGGATGLASSTGRTSLGITNLIPFHWSIADENGVQVDPCIAHFPAASTIVSIRAGNKTEGDTVTFNLGYSTGVAANTTSTLNKLFTSNQVITATTTPGILLTINASSTPEANTCLTYWSSAASSTQFFINGFYIINP